MDFLILLLQAGNSAMPEMATQVTSTGGLIDIAISTLLAQGVVGLFTLICLFAIWKLYNKNQEIQDVCTAQALEREKAHKDDIKEFFNKFELKAKEYADAIKEMEADKQRQVQLAYDYFRDEVSKLGDILKESNDESIAMAKDIVKAIQHLDRVTAFISSMRGSD